MLVPQLLVVVETTIRIKVMLGLLRKGIVAVLVLVASLYPLFRAARISPVDAIGRGR